MKRDVEDFYLLLHPRPVILIVTMSEEGKVNIMSCSWNTPLAEEPPFLGISIWKGSYTHELLKEIPEFTANIPDLSLLKQVVTAGTKSGRKVDKVKLMKITLEPSRRVKPPIIKECIGHLECVVADKVDVGECTLFIGRILEAYANEDCFKGIGT